MAASRFSFLLLLALTVVLSPSSAPLGGGMGFAAAIPMLELEEMVAALRFHGYHLFSNAIMTSDLRLRLLDGPAFTIFAPADAAVFSLDMASASADDYFRSLLFHISPVRLTLASLRSLPSASSFPSLLDDSVHQLHHLGRDHRSVVSVDGAAVVSPGVFYGPHVAVHGLDRSLDVRKAPSPAQLDVGLAAPAPPPFQGTPLAYDTSWIHPGVSSSDRAAAPPSASLAGVNLDAVGEYRRSPSPAGFVEKRLDSVVEYMQSPSPGGFAEERLDAFGEYRRSPSPSGFVEKRLDSAGEYMQSPSPAGFAAERLDAEGVSRSPSPGSAEERLDAEREPHPPSPGSSIGNERFLPEFNCAVTSTEMCGIRDSTLGVVDDEGSAKSGAVGGLHEDDAGYLGEKRERVFLAPSPSFDLVPTSPTDECSAALDVDDDDEAKSVALTAKCKIVTSAGMGQDDASDAKIADHVAPSASQNPRRDVSDDLL